MEYYLGNSSFSDKSANSVVRHGESFSSLTCSIETGSDVRCAHSGSNHLRVKREKDGWFRAWLNTMLYIRKERGYPIDASERWKCCWDQTLLYKPLVGKGLQWQIAWLVSQIIMLPSPGLFPILFYRTQQIQIDYNNKKGLCLSWIRRHFNMWYLSLFDMVTAFFVLRFLPFQTCPTILVQG